MKIIAVLLLVATPVAAFSKTARSKGPTKTEGHEAKVQVGGDGAPIYVPPPKVVKCSEKILIKGRATLAQRIKDKAAKRGARELERSIATNCNQLPSKYVPESLNREYLQTITALSEAKFEIGDVRGCLRLTERLTDPDSASNYSELGFEAEEPMIEKLEAIGGKCLQASGRVVKRDDSHIRKPSMFERGED